MEKYIIEGGHKLSGSITISGNKNEALPAIAACLLTKETVTLRNVPRIGDVETMLEIIASLGAEIKRLSETDISITCKNIKQIEIDNSIVGSVLLISDFSSVKRRQKQNLIVSGSVFLLSLLIAFLLSSRLQRLISNPFSVLQKQRVI